MTYDYEKAEEHYPKSIDKLFQWAKGRYKFQRVDNHGLMTSVTIDPLNLQ